MVDTDELTDTDYTRIRQILQKDYNLPAPKDDTVSAINEAAEGKASTRMHVCSILSPRGTGKTGAGVYSATTSARRLRTTATKENIPLPAGVSS